MKRVFNKIVLVALAATIVQPMAQASGAEAAASSWWKNPYILAAGAATGLVGWFALDGVRRWWNGSQLPVQATEQEVLRGFLTAMTSGQNPSEVFAAYKPRLAAFFPEKTLLAIDDALKNIQETAKNRDEQSFIKANIALAQAIEPFKARLEQLQGKPFVLPGMQPEMDGVDTAQDMQQPLPQAELQNPVNKQAKLNPEEETVAPADCVPCNATKKTVAPKQDSLMVARQTLAKARQTLANTQQMGVQLNDVANRITALEIMQQDQYEDIARVEQEAEIARYVQAQYDAGVADKDIKIPSVADFIKWAYEGRSARIQRPAPAVRLVHVPKPDGVLIYPTSAPKEVVQQAPARVVHAPQPTRVAMPQQVGGCRTGRCPRR